MGESRIAQGLRRFGAAFVLAFLAAVALPSAASADVEDFVFERWDAVYEVDVDDDGRAIAHVTETIVAGFPDHDQNRGMVRFVARDYQGASTDPRDFSVTDQDGDPVPFELERGSDDSQDEPYVAVLTGDDEYVHGPQTYVIEYTLSDVVLARDDGESDEFFWDLLPSARAQDVASFQATISFGPELADLLTGERTCYVGAAETSGGCSIEEADGSLRIGPLPVSGDEGITAAIGLEPGSVVQPDSRLPNPLLDVVPFFLAGAALVTSLGGVIGVVAMQRRRRTATGTVVAQFDVPRNLPPMIAASILGTSTNVFAAQIVHLAVNGAIRIEEDPDEKKPTGKDARPQLRLVDPSRTGDALDRLALRTLFAPLEPGETFRFSDESTSVTAAMHRLVLAGSRQAERRGYVEKIRNRAAVVLGLVTIGIVAVLAVLVILGLVFRPNPAAAIVGLLVGIAALSFGVILLGKHTVLTPAGAEAREHLLGVREFIRVAEQDRFRMLQSYEGAERRPDGTVDVIHLYELLLPYAMLFGLEKQWGKVLETAYEADPGHTAAWYPALIAQGAGNLGGGLSGMVSSLSTSVSYSSSSAGGASGGGFVGGGGGGGGAGGR